MTNIKILVCDKGCGKTVEDLKNNFQIADLVIDPSKGGDKEMTFQILETPMLIPVSGILNCFGKEKCSIHCGVPDALLDKCTFSGWYIVPSLIFKLNNQFLIMDKITLEEIKLK